MNADKWFGDNVATIITIVLSCFTILSYYLALNEYYSKKAYWEIYHVHKMCREGMRSGFHAEYLSVATIILIPFGAIMYMVKSFWQEIQKQCFFWCAMSCIVVSLVSLFIIWIMTRKLYLTQYNERIVWENKKLFNKHVSMVSRLLFMEYGVGILFMIVGIFVCMKKNNYMILIPILFCTLIYMQFQNYSRQLKLQNYRKWVDVIEIKDENYAVIEECNGFLYLVKCIEKKQENELILKLDNFLIHKINSEIMTTKYYSKISRECNSRNCNRNYIIGLRDIR